VRRQVHLLVQPLGVGHMAVVVPAAAVPAGLADIGHRVVGHIAVVGHKMVALRNRVAAVHMLVDRKAAVVLGCSPVEGDNLDYTDRAMVVRILDSVGIRLGCIDRVAGSGHTDYHRVPTWR